MYKPAKLANRNMATALALALAIIGGVVAGTAHSASQGSPGATSSATAKITLRILPREDSVAAASYLSSVAHAAQGHRALQAYCADDAAFNRPEGLFQAGWADDLQSDELEQALRSRCSAGEAAALPSRQPAQDQLTVVIAPV